MTPWMHVIQNTVFINGKRGIPDTKYTTEKHMHEHMHTHKEIGPADVLVEVPALVE